MCEFFPRVKLERIEQTGNYSLLEQVDPQGVGLRIGHGRMGKGLSNPLSFKNPTAVKLGPPTSFQERTSKATGREEVTAASMILLCQTWAGKGLAKGERSNPDLVPEKKQGAHASRWHGQKRLAFHRPHRVFFSPDAHAGILGTTLRSAQSPAAKAAKAT